MGRHDKNTTVKGWVAPAATTVLYTSILIRSDWSNIIKLHSSYQLSVCLLGLSRYRFTHCRLKFLIYNNTLGVNQILAQ